jgi:hypothetical protein
MTLVVFRRAERVVASVTSARGRDSVMPPVRSASPSRRLPYFKASYEPCNLTNKLKNK